MKKKFIFILAFLFLFLIPSASRAGWISKKAPEFTLLSLSGRQISLASLRGKVLFIDFWASWCSPCKKEFPALKAFSSQYSASKFVVLAVSVDKRRSNVERFLSAYPNIPENIKVLLDEDSTVVTKYAARAIPTSFIVDGDGVIRYVHYGFNESDLEKWRSEINGLLK